MPFRNSNVEPTCRAVVNVGEGLDARFSRCMAEEENARVTAASGVVEVLPSARAASCASMASGSGIQSYVELLACLELERDAAKLEEKEKSDH